MLDLVVFLCGAMVMVLELAGSRILAPVLGTSVVVWTSLIGVILGCLSLGYWLGGRLADKTPSTSRLAAIILGAAAWTAMASPGSASVLGLVQAVVPGAHLGSIAATLLLFGPPSVLLGMVSPYAVRLRLTGIGDSGAQVGRLYALSTVGSIVGTFLTGFVLLSLLGSRAILLTVAAGLALAALAACPARRLGPLAVLAFCALAGFWLSAERAGQAATGQRDVDTAYQRVLVTSGKDARTGRPVRTMSTGPGYMQSAMYLDDTLELALRYPRFFDLALHFAPRARRFLVLGGGACSWPRHILAVLPDARVDVVELDPGVTGLARELFALGDDPRLRVIHEDARVFLNSYAGPSYDVVIMDVFSAHYAVPFHLATVEALSRVRALTAGDGVLLVNAISALRGPKGQFARALAASLDTSFPRVEIFAVQSPGALEAVQNLVLAAFPNTAEPAFQSADQAMAELLRHRVAQSVPRDLPAMTDDLAPVDRYTLALAGEF